ncbi:molybdopterin molybdotransferase MoeA [Aquisediminimonas profunda]|uniref:molybdopterin molybdotransferase MoeA n=1 Tax=Aquisediminimonas profunda TaxID=1550733 RepID=UPI001C629E44|nr:gephyrin-like molybdotransferase Glp [Aquisediminimonas profunda]
MISLEAAQARLVALASPLPLQTVSLADATGRWSADDVYSKRTQPARALSAMDGYAMAGGSVGPWRVIGESAAGRPFAGRVGDGEAARIFTGAAVPHGADAVVIQENIVRDGNIIRVAPADVPITGRHIRQQGSDFRAGDLLIKSGDRLMPAQVALAAGGGYDQLTVRRRPRVALIATGDELVAPGVDAGDDFLPESNTTMLAGLLDELKCDIKRIGIIPDNLSEIVAAIRAADADLLITLGGASVGDHDLVRPALEACGAKLDFWKVAMRPGKPVMAGQLGNMLVLGLPGNPVSAFVTALLFAKPVAAALAGANAPLARQFTVRVAAPLPANGERIDHLRARNTAAGVVPVGPNDSASLGGLAGADCLIVRPPNAPAADIGDTVPIYILD